MTHEFLPEGLLLGTPENKAALSSLEALERAMKNEQILEKRVLICDPDYNLILDICDCRAVIPREEAAVTEDGMWARDIAIITRVGKAVQFIVTDIVTEDGKTVIYLSRKKAQEKCLEKYLDLLNDGDIINARVTHFEPFGCFCDIGCGVISLLSIDCISVSRILHPSDRFYLGQYILAAVKCRDDVILGKRGRIALTHKELLGTWQENADRFKIGQTVTGIVRSIESYGIFIELAPNLAGLAERKEGVKVGEIAAVYIKNIIPSKMKVKLVLIDSYSGDRSLIKTEYFRTKGNISDWRYQPDIVEG
ncbi:MAG: 30S ribosomal protein S1 [Clostridia bacterium]|nr:30S ribosomal protein S1 [Clostridia bacterium]